MSYPDSLHNVEEIYISLIRLNYPPAWNLLHLTYMEEFQVIKVA